MNDTFETIVEEASETIKSPLVSPYSNHGIWVKNFLKSENITAEELNDRIQKYLDLKEYKPCRIYTRKEKPRGNLRSYDLGTIVMINGSNNTKYLLVAISKFDQNNNAQSTKSNIRDSLDSTILFYSNNCQSAEIFIPLFGTGSSRSGLSHTKSFQLMKTTILTTDYTINGHINLVVYSKDKDKVSIFK